MASIEKKWLVQPVLAMREVGTMLVLVMVEVEGPSDGSATDSVKDHRITLYK